MFKKRLFPSGWSAGRGPGLLDARLGSGELFLHRVLAPRLSPAVSLAPASKSRHARGQPERSRRRLLGLRGVARVPGSGPDSLLAESSVAQAMRDLARRRRSAQRDPADGGQQKQPPGSDPWPRGTRG